VIRHRLVGVGFVELTFVLPTNHPAEPVGVAGEFNEWSWESTPFEDVGGALFASVLAALTERYRFRYRGSNGGWFNDDNADDYVANGRGGVDCVFDTAVERRSPSTVEVLNSPNHLAVLQRIAEVSARHDDRAVTEDQIFAGMTYTLGTRDVAVQPGAGAGPLSHLLADLAEAELLENCRQARDRQPRWTITPAGRDQLTRR
jgi:hypothetical protein